MGCDSQTSFVSQSSSSTRQSQRKRKTCSYNVPDSDASSDSEDPNFERLVKAVALPKRRHFETPRSQLESLPQSIPNDCLPPISLGTQTDCLPPISQGTQTDEPPPTPITRHELPTHHIAVATVSQACKSTQTDIGLRHNLMGSISRWSRPVGKDMELRLNQSIADEETKNLQKLTKKQRKINLELLGRALMSVTRFAYVTRRMKTRGSAIVFCTFRYLCQWRPDLFQDAILVESRQYLRRHVFQPWKFQKSIDTNAAGGLNYESCNSIRVDVEELGPRTIGCIPHGTTIAKYAKLLEQHAVQAHGLDIIVEKTIHGPSLTFVNPGSGTS
jgi:hypothetical protein